MLWWILLRLKSKDSLKREAAIVKLTSRGTRAFEPLVGALSDADAGVRQAAARALGEIRDDRAAAHLVPLLKDSASFVREEAVRAVGKLGEEQLVELLRPALHDSSGSVRDAAVQLIMGINRPGVAEILQEYEADERIRQEAEAHRKAELQRRETELQREREILSLIGDLKVGNEEKRKAARKALARFGEAAIPSLSAALHDCVYRVREKYTEKTKALSAAQAQGGEWAALEAAKRYGDDYVLHNARFFLAETLADIGGLGSVAALVPYVGESFATRQIARIGPIAVDRLLEVLRKGSTESQGGAAEALGIIRDARAVEPLIEALLDSQDRVKHFAAESLGQIGDARAVEALIKTLGNAGVSGLCRQSVAVALDSIGDVRAAKPLAEALGDDYLVSYARHTIDKSLLKFGASAVEPLICALANCKGEARARTAQVLERILNHSGPEVSSEYLLSASRLPDAAKDDCLRIRQLATAELTRRDQASSP
jgi:HEAT repeat protein